MPPLTPTWTPLNNPAPAFIETCLLLTDATVMCHEYNSNRWHRLSPDIFGSYANGTWDNPPIAPMPNGTDPSFGCFGCTYAPLFYASAVLPDGRVVVIGGEDVNLTTVWTNIGFIYDPVTNTWSSQLNEVFGGGRVGDSMSKVLANGTFVLSDILSGNIEALNPATLSFTALNPMGKLDINNEEGWSILYDGTLLTVDTRIVASSERYNPASNAWTFAGSTIVNMADTGGAPVDGSDEIGPCVLRPDRRLVCFSGNSLGQNALFDTTTNTWSHPANMDFPLVPGQTYHFAMADGPAALLPNGNVLAMASPVINGSPFNAPSHFYEVDLATNTLTQTVDPPNAAAFPSFTGRMLVLPSGQILLSAFDEGATQTDALYSNGGAPQNAWRPVITTPPPATLQVGNTYTIAGRLFNGFSEGAYYGDDAQMSTNYPLVRITNQATGHVFYARTHNHSRMGVEPVGSTEVVSTRFDVPNNAETGASSLVVVVNGISSAPITVQLAQAALPCVFGSQQLSILDRSVVNASIAAGNFLLGSAATVNGNGDVAGNADLMARSRVTGTLRVAGTVTEQAGVVVGNLVNPAVVVLPALPTKSFPVGTGNMFINAGGPPITLNPGNFGNVTISGPKVVNLNPGTYNFASLTVFAGVTLNFSGTSATVINVQGNLMLSSSITYGAANPALISWYSNANINVDMQQMPAFPGSLLAPNGSVRVAPQDTVNGCVRGRSVEINAADIINGQ